MSLRLLPSQVCFVVDDVRGAAAQCEEQYGWGPFYHFNSHREKVRWRGWTGTRDNDVALGMAGGVQVELVHVNEGREPIAEYQDRYGIGFQHLGMACRSLEAGVEQLTSLGAVVAERNEHEGIEIAFVDVPTGPAMFELLQFPPREEGNTDLQASARPSNGDVFALDRASIVTGDMPAALRFYAQAFGWENARAKTETLRHGEDTSTVDCYRARAGALTLELLGPRRGGSDPYARHLERGEHGLVHAGGVARPGEELGGDALECEWVERAERFRLFDWAGGRRSLQVRDDPAARNR